MYDIKFEKSYLLYALPKFTPNFLLAPQIIYVFGVKKEAGICFCLWVISLTPRATHIYHFTAENIQILFRKNLICEQ